MNGGGVAGCGASSGFPVSRASRCHRRGSSRSAISSYASHAAAAEPIRAAGSLLSSPWIQSEISSSIDGSIARTGGMGSLTWRMRIAIGASMSWNGTRPVNSSKAMQPTE